MAVAWTYTPPTINAVARVQSAGEAAVLAGAEHLLEAAQRVVPVESGRLRDSGRVSPDGMEAAVSFGREDDAEIIGWSGDIAQGSSASADYAEKQHEDLTLEHPHGGEGKYLERPMHSEKEAIAEILAETVRKALLL